MRVSKCWEIFWLNGPFKCTFMAKYPEWYLFSVSFTSSNTHNGLRQGLTFDHWPQGWCGLQGDTLISVWLIGAVDRPECCVARRAGGEEVCVYMCLYGGLHICCLSYMRFCNQHRKETREKKRKSNDMKPRNEMQQQKDRKIICWGGLNKCHSCIPRVNYLW